MFSEWLCGACYPKIIKGTFGKVILHGMNFHKLRFKEARANLTLESEAKKWQEKKDGDRLTERRAEFVYNAARIAAIAAQAPVIPVLWEERELLFKSQFLVVIERQCGSSRSSSPEELHESWMQAYFAMGWVYGHKYDRGNKIHPDLVPYKQLGKLEQDKDSVFVALCEIARQWIEV